MSYVQLILPLALIVASMATSLSAQAPEPKVLFHARFDGSTAASTAGGKPEALTAQDLSFTTGVVGQAVSISPNSLLEFACDDNLIQKSGTVSMWFKPNWRAADMGSDSKDWHCLFSQRLPDGQERIGSGMLWFWFYGASLRGDLSDTADTYKTAGNQGLDQTTWAHLAFTWDIDRGSRLYMNGIQVGSAGDGNSPLDVKKGQDYSALKNTFESFWVGSQGGMARANGAIDEFRIYDRALTPAEVAADMALVSPLRLDCLSSFLVEGQQGKVDWSLTNVSADLANLASTYKLTSKTGKVVAQGQLPSTSLACGARQQFTTTLPTLPKGEYKLAVQSTRGPERTASIWMLGRDNAYLTKAGKLQSTLLETIDLTKGLPANRTVLRGQSKAASLNGRPYYELGSEKNDRIAIHVQLPEAGVPYLVEWDYPDDKLRTMELVAHDTKDAWADYALQTGVFCGDEFPNSGQMMTHRCILWPKSKDTAFIFMTNRKGAPAAVAELRISRINGGLPDAAIKDAAPVDGWTRTVGIYFEDPAIGYDFGINGQLMPSYEELLDRLIAYMKFSGQDMLTYPAVWYHGRINTAYQPRPHEEDYIACILAKFAQHDLGFMPTINLQNIPVPEDVKINATTFADGSLHNSPVMILSSGTPNPGLWHGSPPNFNPLHPAVQDYVNKQVDDLVDRYGQSPAFKGITLHLTKHTIPWFGDIKAGYNDYNIEAFEKDTGVRVQVDRKDPLRGKLYYEWLMANARDQWVQWRCQQIAKWYIALADRISAKRPDLRLSLCSYNPTITDHNDDKRFATDEFALIANLESGIDPELYTGRPNIIMTQTIYPSDYRHTGPDQSPGLDYIRDSHTKAGTYELLRGASLPWINMHDRYFEDGIGGARWWGKNDPLKADWFKEVPWRVSVLNANQNYFLEHYVMPLRYSDVLGINKGGFLIGTLGMEDQLASFSRAFRALPARKFDDLPGSTDLVKARFLKDGDSNYLYVVNTGRDPSSLTISLNGNPREITDLATGQTVKAESGQLKVDVARYQLRSFKLQGANATSANP